MKKIILALGLIFSVNSFGIILTDAQKLALKTDALSQPSIATCIANADDVCVANYYNTQSATIVWKSYQSEIEIYNDPGFDWTLVDGLTQGKRDEWNMLFKQGFFNPNNPNKRAAIADVWTGTAAKVNVQTAILNVCKRNANNLEALFSTGLGTNLSPSTMTIEGTITPGEISNIIR